VDPQQSRIRQSTWFGVAYGLIAFAAWAYILYHRKAMPNPVDDSVWADSPPNALLFFIISSCLLSMAEFGAILSSRVLVAAGSVWLLITWAIYALLPMTKGSDLVSSTWFVGCGAVLVGIVGLITNALNKRFSPSQIDSRPFLGKSRSPASDRVMSIVDLVLLAVIFLSCYLVVDEDVPFLTTAAALPIAIITRAINPKRRDRSALAGPTLGNVG
jgi:hypothetical protein